MPGISSTSTGAGNAGGAVRASGSGGADDAIAAIPNRVRNSRTRYKDEDGIAISEAIRAASANPVSRPVDPRQLTRSANLYKVKVKSEEGEIERVVTFQRLTKKSMPLLKELLAIREGPGDLGKSGGFAAILRGSMQTS